MYDHRRDSDEDDEYADHVSHYEKSFDDEDDENDHGFDDDHAGACRRCCQKTNIFTNILFGVVGLLGVFLLVWLCRCLKKFYDNPSHYYV